MKDSILIFTNEQDISVDSVIEILKQRQEKFFRFNTEKFPNTCSLSIGLDQSNFSGSLILSDKSKINLSDIKSCWYRHVGKPLASASNSTNPYKGFIQAESLSTLWSLYTTIDAFWMNNPLIGVKLFENNKFYQMKLASMIGFKTPKTLISNNYQELLNFCDSCGGVIATKLICGKIFRDPKEKLKVVYTQKITHEYLVSKRNSIELSPIFAQEYIPKKLELRITVIGNKIFPCAIHSQDSIRTKDDWRRYDFDNVKHETYDLPAKVKTSLIKFMDISRLSYGAFDLILTPDDEYVFLEVNPSGQWGWIEEITKMPISQAIADILINPPS